MTTRTLRRWSTWGLLGLAAVLSAAGLTAGPSFAASDAEVYIVQGLPGRTVDVAFDGNSVAKGVKTAEVAGPFTVKSGSRKVTFRDGDDVLLESTFTVQPRSSWDVAIHLPAETKSKPAITVFRNDLSAVPKGKASLTVAHTAKVPPADIRVNGDVLFADVGNGESLNLVVPVATYKVAIVPAGEAKPVILGPVDLTVKGGALNRVYAIGDPEEKTMNVAVHVITVATTGSGTPDRVDTGTGGQASGLKRFGPVLWR